MDIEGLKSLVWLIVWGGLFFFMMRYGCGAHIGGHGHGGHGEHRAPGAPPAKDPVCGMDVDPSRATAAAGYGGTTYYFCSASCRDKFEKTPGKYLPGSGTAAAEHGGPHHG